MAFLEVLNVAIKGISAAVPKRIEETVDYPLFSKEDAEKFIASTGIERKRIDTVHSFSDLAVIAADQLIKDLEWKKDEIEAIIVVSQSLDYKLPATSCIIQNRLELGEECFTLDISLGCSGWVYGLSTLSALMSNGGIKKAIMLAGDTSKSNIQDKSAYPLFGNTATATALEYTNEADSIKFHLATDGSGYEAIIIPDGGDRNPFTDDSLLDVKIEEGITRNKTNVILEGMDVFSFGITKPPASVNKLIEKFELDKDAIDYFTFHQANKFMNEKIRKKLKIEEGKHLYSLQDFGNTSSASIPLTLLTQIPDQLRNKNLQHLACGFGVGLSWASVHFSTNNIVCSKLIEI